VRASIRGVRFRRVDRAQWIVALLVLSLIAAACSSSEPAATTTTVAPTSPATTTPPETSVATTTTSVATTTTVAPGLIGALPQCEDAAVIPASIDDGQVSFIAGGTVYVADADGTNVQCVTQASSDEPFLWGPAADRLVAGDAVITEDAATPAPTTAMQTWSRPTGKALVWVDGGRLLKSNIVDIQARDLTFLARHDAVTYHPAGVEIATTGEADDGTRGVWLASNEGGDPRLIVRAEEAIVHDFTFTHDGQSAFFLAEHDDEWHVHDIFLVLPEGDPEANEFDATIRYSSAGPLSHLVVSPWDWMWAAQDRTCGSGARVVIGDTVVPLELAEVETYPVGWLPGPRLVVAAYGDGCDGVQDLWVLDVGFDGASSATLLVSGVAGAAVRAAVPDPPPPLGDVSTDAFTW